MPRIKSQKSADPEYSFISAKVISHRAAVDASINYEVLDKKRLPGTSLDTKVYNFDTRLEIEGLCTSPEEEVGKACWFTVSASERHNKELSTTLGACHVIDDDGRKTYRTVKGQPTPIYNLPKSIGYLDRQRGTSKWTGWIWLPSKTVSDMLALLAGPQQLYIHVHKMREGRIHHMRGFTLQTYDPLEE